MPIEHTRLRGAKFLMVTCVMEALFPILAHYASTIVQPVFYYGVCLAFAAGILAIYQLLFGSLSFRLHFQEWLSIVGVSVFVVTATVFIFIGTRMTSVINTVVLIQAEIFFAFLWGRLFFRESPVLLQLFGALAVFTGTLMILFNGTLSVNPGDALILLAVALFPFGNACAKCALKTLPVSKVLFLRYLFGAAIILPLAFLLEDPAEARTQIIDHLWLIGAYAILILFVSKMFWYAGLRWLPVSIATGIVAVAPALSLFFAFVIWGEVPNLFQLSGLICAMGGVFLLVMHSELSLPIDDLV